MTGLTLDTGALIALERRDRRALALIDAAHHDDVRITVPTPVVAEWWRGQRTSVASLLDAFDVERTSLEVARAAGEALARVGRGPSVVDAIVVASAAFRGDRVLTGDVRDLERLGSYFPGVRLLKV